MYPCRTSGNARLAVETGCQLLIDARAGAAGSAIQIDLPCGPKRDRQQPTEYFGRCFSTSCRCCFSSTRAPRCARRLECDVEVKVQTGSFYRAEYKTLSHFVTRRLAAKEPQCTVAPESKLGRRVVGDLQLHLAKSTCNFILVPNDQVRGDCATQFKPCVPAKRQPAR